MTDTAASVGLPPVVNQNIRVLVVGSLPGRASLDAQEYYAHPRNAFWPIMADLLGFDADLTYELRCQALLHAGVGMWDVIERAVRRGSLDARIQTSTLQTNDFSRVFREWPRLDAIATNGRKAAETLSKMQRNGQFDAGARTVLSLPSTSAAYAAMPYEKKREQWSSLLQYLPGGNNV